MPYYPPLGWIGIGLKVMDKYEDNIWIGMENCEGEWSVAYHGVGHKKKSNEIKQIAKNIYKGGFKKGSGQYHEHCNDLNHPGKKVGEGVYCTPKIEKAEGYAGIVDIEGRHYKLVLMVRVNPKKIRYCEHRERDYWVVSGTTDDIRPYRILYKECNN